MQYRIKMAGRIKERKGKVWVVKVESYARIRWKKMQYINLQVK